MSVDTMDTMNTISSNDQQNPARPTRAAKTRAIAANRILATTPDPVSYELKDEEQQHQEFIVE